jgi:hypothetical protein
VSAPLWSMGGDSARRAGVGRPIADLFTHLPTRSGPALDAGGKAHEGAPTTRSGGTLGSHIGKRAIGALRTHGPLQDKEWEWAACRDDDPVVTREDGRDLFPGLRQRSLQPAPAPTGLHRPRLHDLRHGAAALMPVGDVDIAVISKHLRHSSIRVTGDICRHLLRVVDRQAAEALALE